MVVKRIFLSSLLLIGIVLLAIGFFAGSGTTVSANDRIDKIEDKDYIDSIRSEDSVEIIDGKTKTYISRDKQLRIEDSSGVALEMKLISPYKNKVSSGNSVMIAEWFLIDFSDKLEIFDRVDSYNINDGYKVKTKIYVWKYLVETEITDCYDGSQINNKTGKNETAEVCYDYTQEDWIEFSDTNDLPNKNIYVGIFTNTVEGEYVEFVPTIKGFEILEWASFLVDDLISYYKMDDVSSGAVDIHGSNDMSETGALTYSQAGKIVDSILWNSDNEYLSDADFSGEPTGANDRTVNTWLNWPGNAATSHFFGYGANVNNQLVAMSVLTNGKVRANFKGTFIDSTFDLSTNIWYMVTFVQDSGTQRLYINGQANGTSSATLNTPASAVYIGTTPHVLTEEFRGRMDEVGIWSRALNTTEILLLYNSGNAFAYPFVTIINCQFSGFVKDEQDGTLEGANITIWNQFDVTEFYETSSDVNGEWEINVTNSTNTYMVGAYFNNTLIGQLKPFISGTC